MDLTKLNLDDAKTSETFGGVALTSGAYNIEVLSCDKATSQDGATSLNFKIKIGESTRYTTLWLNKLKDGAIVENEYNSRRLKQLLILLKINPSTLTEVATDKIWLVNIPQIKGNVGAVLEVSPANTKYNKKEYPKIDIASFYIFNTMQTLKEFTDNKNAEAVQKEVEKLQAKEYIFTSGGTATPSPQQFDASSDLTSDDLPFWSKTILNNNQGA